MFPTVFLVTCAVDPIYQELIKGYIQKGYKIEKEEKLSPLEDGSIIIRVQMKLENGSLMY